MELSALLPSVISVLVALASGGLFGAWVVRANAKDATKLEDKKLEVTREASEDTHEVTLLRTFSERLATQERTIGELQERINHVLEESAKWQQMWSDERHQKHEAMDRAQAQVMQAFKESAEKELTHERELGELRACIAEQSAKIEAQQREIDVLQRKVARFEGAADDGA